MWSELIFSSALTVCVSHLWQIESNGNECLRRGVNSSFLFIACILKYQIIRFFRSRCKMVIVKVNERTGTVTTTWQVAVSVVIQNEQDACKGLTWKSSKADWCFCDPICRLLSTNQWWMLINSDIIVELKLSANIRSYMMKVAMEAAFHSQISANRGPTMVSSSSKKVPLIFSSHSQVVISQKRERPSFACTPPTLWPQWFSETCCLNVTSVVGPWSMCLEISFHQLLVPNHLHYHEH